MIPPRGRIASARPPPLDPVPPPPLPSYSSFKALQTYTASDDAQVRGRKGKKTEKSWAGRGAARRCRRRKKRAGQTPPLPPPFPSQWLTYWIVYSVFTVIEGALRLTKW